MWVPGGPCAHFGIHTAENLLPRSCEDGEECECAAFERCHVTAVTLLWKWGGVHGCFFRTSEDRIVFCVACKVVQGGLRLSGIQKKFSA